MKHKTGGPQAMYFCKIPFGMALYNASVVQLQRAYLQDVVNVVYSAIYNFTKSGNLGLFQCCVMSYTTLELYMIDIIQRRRCICIFEKGKIGHFASFFFFFFFLRCLPFGFSMDWESALCLSPLPNHENSPLQHSRQLCTPKEIEEWRTGRA